MYPEAYVQYLLHFHGDRDYFECHEVLEEYWKRTDPGNKYSIWVALIQLAVSCYHHRRKNFPGAGRMLKKASSIFSSQQHLLPKLGLNPDDLLTLLNQRLAEIEAKQPYKSFDLPLCDPLLLKDCKDSAEQSGIFWGSKSDMDNISLINRHMLRDRTDVIEKRSESLAKKRQRSMNR